ncbi:unnamed protein product [Owenia fusiformis]|uniref:NADAR domain-containing protein n=1 Tax=Owenia fusiformis TaxID=6347 RepID=A0A8S4PXG0_OWEFU|nr:unnamed protein product [Owenia fusiformis]
MEESFPAPVERNRKILLPIYKAARVENMRASLTADTLIVDGRKYRVNDLQRLPEKIGFAASQRKVADVVTLFNSATSPLGRNYPCSFSDKGRIFHSVAQYVAYAQADMFEDHDAASRVMASQNPSACEKIGKNANGFSDALWKMRVEAVLEKANTLKFEQNPELIPCLRSTSGTDKIGECNPYDNFYGTGCKIADLVAGTPDQWPGKNINGNILKRLRDKLDS